MIIGPPVSECLTPLATGMAIWPQISTLPTFLGHEIHGFLE